MGLRVDRGSRLLTRGTDAHLPTPGSPLHQERGRILAALTEIAHEGREGAMVPRGPLGHALTEGSGQRILEGWQRRVGTPAPCSAGTDRWGGAVHAWFPPPTRSCARPSGRFPTSLMSCPPLPLGLFGVDLES